MYYQLIGKDVLSTPPHWAFTGFARCSVENCTAFIEVLMGTTYVYTQDLQSAWSKVALSGRTFVENCAVAVCCLDVGSEFI